MRKLHTLIFVFIVSAGLMLQLTQICAQQSQISPLNFTEDLVKERLKNALADEKLTEENKKTLNDLAQKTLTSLNLLKQLSEKITSYQTIIDSAQEELQKYKNNSLETEEKVDFKNLSILVLEQKEVQLEKELDLTEKEIKLLTQELNKRAENRIEIPKQILDLKNKLNQNRASLTEISQKEITDDISMMKSMHLKARIQSLNYEIESLEKELRMYDATVNILPVKQEFLTKKSNSFKEKIVSLNKELTKKRTAEVNELARKTKNKTPAHPALKELVAKNQGLASQLTGPEGIVQKLDNITNQSDKAMKDLKNLDKLFSDIKSKVEVTGMTPALGLYMRNKRDSLSNLHFYIEDRRTLMAEVQTQLLHLEDERTELSNIDNAIKQVIINYNTSIEETEKTQVVETAKKIIELRIDLLDKMIKNLNLYFIELVELDTYQRLLISKIQQYRSFVDEYLIWYRSAPRLNLEDFQTSSDFASQLLDSDEWTSAWKLLCKDCKKEPFLYGSILLLVLLLVLFRKRLGKAINSLSETVTKYDTDSLGATFKGILFSLLYILSFPLVLLFIGWRLHNVAGSSLFILGLAQGFFQAGMVYLVLKITAVFCKPGGIGDIHFKWNSDSLALIIKHLRWFTPVTIFLFFVSALITSVPADNLVMGKSFFRLIFLIRMVVFAIFVFLVVNPNRGPVQRFIERRKGYLAERLRYFWYLPGIIYIFLAVLPMLGYVYTAQQFDLRLQKTFFLFLVVSFIYGFSLRCLIYIRRKLALERVRQKQEAKEAHDQTPEDGSVKEEPMLETESLYAMGQDTKKIIATFIFIIVLFSLWLIWKDLFPAFNMFSRINLWSTNQTITEIIDKSGGGFEKTIQTVVPVSLADLMLALVILLLSLIIVKNLSGILQILILQHMKIEKGTRFAIISITRYAITLIGFLIACSCIGVSWSKVQWLVAAVSVGLGFGLQEIFANFISGLIILLEQPIRVGDVVTVGEVTGYVTQIKIRATTITDWNKKELIVPNKEFITSRLVNWSLSDKVIRLTIPVGIAYGSDTKKAEEVLYQVAKEHPDVLADPAPTVLFDSFSESSLTFELRVFIPSFDYFIQIRHDLHMNIDAAFRKAGIEIAFPQRDIHIRSIETPLEVQDKNIRPEK